MRRFIIALVICSISLSCMAAIKPASNKIGGVLCSKKSLTCRTQSPPKRFVFALTNVFAQSDELAALIASPVDGVSFQIGWAQLEPLDNSYTWSILDNAIFTVGTGHKLVTLIILASPISVVMPSWLPQAHDDANCGIGVTPQYVQGQVVPWDCVYASKFGQFITALGAHINGSPGLKNTIFAVDLTFPVSEMTIIGCFNGVFYGGETFNPNPTGQSIPYDRAAYYAAWQNMGGVLEAAFPKKVHVVSAPVRGFICGGTTDTAFYSDLMTYLSTTYGRNFFGFAADLNAYGSDRMSFFPEEQSTSPVGFQTIWSATDQTPGHPKFGGTYPSNLLAAVCLGQAYAATYFEIYSVDVRNSDPTIQKAISAGHDPVTYCNQ